MCNVKKYEKIQYIIDNGYPTHLQRIAEYIPQKSQGQALLHSVSSPLHYHFLLDQTCTDITWSKKPINKKFHYKYEVCHTIANP